MDYRISKQKPDARAFCQLVKDCGLIEKDIEAIEIGLNHALFTVAVYDEGTLIGTGRVVGDGATVFHIVDVAVHPNYQGNGLGGLIMENIMTYIEEHKFKGTYVNLIAYNPANYLYEKFGFQYVKDNEPAMFIEY